MTVGSQLFVSALGLGMAYNAAPGAVNTESLRRGLAHGYRPALLVQLGALIGDSTWAAVALTGTALFLQNRSVRLLLGVAGACFLLRLAWSALLEARSGRLPPGRSGQSPQGESGPIAQRRDGAPAGERESGPGRSSRGDFATGAVFSLANPFALAFWTGIGGGLAATGSGPGSFVVLFTGFVLGALMWCLCIPVVIGWGRQFVRPAIFRWVNALCGLALGYFSLALLWNTAHALLEHQATSVPPLHLRQLKGVRRE